MHIHCFIYIFYFQSNIYFWKIAMLAYVSLGYWVSLFTTSLYRHTCEYFPWVAILLCVFLGTSCYKWNVKNGVAAPPFLCMFMCSFHLSSKMIQSISVSLTLEETFPCHHINPMLGVSAFLWIVCMWYIIFDFICISWTTDDAVYIVHCPPLDVTYLLVGHSHNSLFVGYFCFIYGMVF